ncbi:flagellar protein FlgN [Nocardioides sp. AE5]|uniref:flagellar protein FlgN n=1 Tax=Nocardioides sp. AE5 TaxID=2962573 RepID=UPI00288226B7|nr:flagellar protein FlgN [Nocardioides sp. AE5]MDT0200818.1 flagellar protein FlgN [Nocardioides sp. AE5]
MEKLSSILWRERELLESLLYRLELEQLVLSSGRTRWLARAAEDVEKILTALRETEVLRAIASDEAAAAVGLEHNTSLRALAEAVDEPWQTILLEHREAFTAITRDISALAATNRELITVGYRAAREALLDLESDGIEGYGHDGSKVSAAARSTFVDRSL